VEGMDRACRERTDYVRRFDPVRMALEHKTLTERLHGGGCRTARTSPLI
jgi:hypothetical protein